MTTINITKTKKQQFKRQAVRIITCSALATILALGPAVYDSDTGFFSYPQAQASSCFIAGTNILMADGSIKAIEAVRKGDYVIGHLGRLNRVTGTEQVPLAGRRLYSLNGSAFFVTAEHPFMSDQGWKSVNPTMTRTENPQLRLQPLQLGDRLYRFMHYQISSGNQGNLALQPVPEVEFEKIELTQLESIDADPQTQVYNLLLDGNHSYIADDYLVHNKGGDDGGDSSGSGGDDGGDSSGSGGGDDGGDSSGSGSGGDDDEDSSGSGSDNDDDEDSSGSDSDDDGDHDDDDDHDSRGLGRGEHNFSDQFHRGHGRGRGRGADDTVEGHRSSGDHSSDEYRVGDRGRGRGADDVIEGHRSSGDHSSDEYRVGDRGRGRGADDAIEGHRSSGDHSLDDFSPAGSDMSRDEEATAIASGWQ